MVKMKMTASNTSPSRVLLHHILCFSSLPYGYGGGGGGGGGGGWWLSG